MKATYRPRRRVAEPIITSVDVFPVPAPATNAKSWPAANASLAASCSAVALKATPHIPSTRTTGQSQSPARLPAAFDQHGSAY
ncbi:hypothetical protein ABT173_09995 [Streptomyces sp. NPDC001795]|uniref:hypothetical protein n=1 Tax=Streptomyces sp. NPDC001795 TaxID=3154525 RepID=UPI00332E5D6D